MTTAHRQEIVANLERAEQSIQAAKALKVKYGGGKKKHNLKVVAANNHKPQSTFHAILVR